MCPGWKYGILVLFLHCGATHVLALVLPRCCQLFQQLNREDHLLVQFLALLNSIPQLHQDMILFKVSQMAPHMLFYNDSFGGRLRRRIYSWPARGELVTIVFSFELGVFRVLVRVVAD